MWSFFAVQETEGDVKALLCNILQISFSNPGNRFICACSDDAFQYIKDVDIKNVELIHRKIDDEWSMKNYAKNWIDTLRYVVDTEEHPVYISRDLFLSKEVPITQEHINQGLAFIKKDTLAPNVQKELQYSLDLMYVKNVRVIEQIEKHYRKETDLFEDKLETIEEVSETSSSGDENTIIQKEVAEEIASNKKELSEEEKNMIQSYQTAWAKIPTIFAEMDDGILSISDYIDGSGYLTTQNFFAFEKSWNIKEMQWKDGFKHNDNDIWGMNIRLNEVNPQVRDLNNKLVNMLLQCEPRFMPLLNMRWSVNGIEMLVPKREGIAHWNREGDDGFYNFIEAVADGHKLLDSKTKESNADYFLFNNNILLDKPDVKYVTNIFKKSFGIMYFDYSEDLLDILNNLDMKIEFGGYYSSYPKVLEDYVDPADVERMGTKELKDSDYCNEEEYKSFLDELSTFKYVAVNKDTPKRKIAECLKLGVVPKLEDNSTLIDLQDIATSDEDWEILSVKCKEYYSKNLSIAAIGNKLLSFVFSK